MKVPSWFVLVVFLMGGVSGAQAVPAPVELAAEPVPNGLGLELNEYALGWSAAGQRAFQVLVASDERLLALEVGDHWDSGKRPGGKISGILCRGRSFGSGATVWWKVRVWSEADQVSEWSAPARIDIAARKAESGARRRPTGSNGGAPAFVDGRRGGAVRLGADGPTLWAEDYDGLRSTAATTIAAWIKPEKVGDGWQCIYRKEDGSNRRILAIGKEGPFWGVWSGFSINGEYVEFGAPYDRAKLGDGQWHHVAVTFDGRHLRLFVDGGEIGKREQPGVLGSGSGARAYIGSHGGDSERLTGGFDDLMVFGVALTGEQVAKLAAGEKLEGPPAPVGHWTFDGTIENEAIYHPDTVRNRIVLLGGTLVSRMDKFGYFESAVTACWPHHEISFRNLGWPADDVLGTARSEFGSAHNTRSWQPPKGERGFGFEKLKRQLEDAQPSTLIVAYGNEAAYAETEEQMGWFEDGYRALIGELESKGAHLILLTPVRHAAHGVILPDPAARNERLQRAGEFIKAFGKERGHPVVDVFGELTLSEPAAGTGVSPDYENGVHLSESGYRALATLLSQKLGIPDGGLNASEARDEATPGFRAGRIDGLTRTKRWMRFDFRADRLAAPWLAHAPGKSDYEGVRVRVDGDPAMVGVDRPVLVSGPDLAQAERLRKAVVEKNQLYRYRLNPINKAYIFLFRRHEMGHLAYEMEDLEDIVQEREKVIAKLRVPEAHRYELEDPADWKAPRNYPDHEVPKDIPAPDVAAELAALKVADGFEVNLFAKNPMIFNPINMNWDRWGRAWVATSSTYPHIVPGRIPNDRIVILEDVDGDGVADTSKVFAEGLTVPHSVLPVKGGAYVCSTTELLFLADHDGDDVADEKRVVFSGFGNADVHHMVHGLRWAPWGDLFFTQSIYINSFVETAHGPRRLNGSGIWRFRPETERLDVYARGMVNPWGLAFDEWGRSFGTDGAGGSGPHDVFPGSAFGTAVGAPRVLRGLIPGKPKNTGAEFMSGRHVPTHWQGSLLANDFRANRTVRYELEERGSGFTAKEVETVLHSSHRSFRPVDIKMGPDGAIYVVDWYNPIIDHGEVDFHHPLRDKTHGRIWRVTAKGRPLVDPPRIAEASMEELMDSLKSPEQYERTQANRELVRREVPAAAITRWVADLDGNDSAFDHHRLEALWLFEATNQPPPALLEQLTTVADPRIRAAAVRAFGRSRDALQHLAIAVEDEHPRVRLEAVSALRGIGSLEAASIALRALGYEVDGNLDFALEMTVRDTREQWLPAMQSGKKVFDGVASRLSYALQKVNDPRAIEGVVALIGKGTLEGEALHNAVATVSALGKAADLEAVLKVADRSPDLLPAIASGAEFNREVPGNAAMVLPLLASEKEAVRVAAAELAGVWKVTVAKDALVRRLGAASSSEERLALAGSLARLGASDALLGLSREDTPLKVRIAAIAARARLDTAAAAGPAATALRDLTDPVEAEVLFHAFLAREAGPESLAKALAEVKLREPVAIAGARAATASGREVSGLIAALTTAGGLKPVSQNLTVEERRVYLAAIPTQGSAERGRVIYERAAMACTTCHLVNGKGGKLGPDLSTVGTYMTPESLFESILNPSTDIKQGYETVLVTQKDQSLVSGLLQRKTDTAVLVRDPTGKVVSIPSGEIAKIDTSPVSLMPPGLTASLRKDELVDLLTYLTALGK